AFLRKIDKKVNLMIMPLDGGEAVKLLQRDDISNIKWSRDGKKIYFISNESKEKEDDIKVIRNYHFISMEKDLYITKDLHFLLHT
ncbi:MAG: hypothetical protein QXD07_02285, partial [Thermoplasmata archaeon]